MNEDIRIFVERAANEHPNCPPLGIAWYIKPMQDAKRSKAAGHPVFIDREMIRITVPGDRNGIPDRPATEQDRQRFPLSYAAFRAGEQKVAVDGFRIEEWPQVTRAMAMTLKAANVHTVEALAAVSDTHIDKVGHNGRELRSKAVAFLAVSKDASAAANFKAESDRKDATIADLQRQINDLAARIDGPRRGPGRPPNQPRVEGGIGGMA